MNSINLKDITIISIFFETMCQIVTIDIHASGNVKLVSAFSGTLFCLAPLFVYILYSFGFSVEWTFIVIALNNAFRLLIYLFILLFILFSLCVGVGLIIYYRFSLRNKIYIELYDLDL